jgi:hypothetical protein
MNLAHASPTRSGAAKGGLTELDAVGMANRRASWEFGMVTRKGW